MQYPYVMIFFLKNPGFECLIKPQNTLTLSILKWLITEMQYSPISGQKSACKENTGCKVPHSKLELWFLRLVNKMACLIIDNSKGCRSYVPHFLGENFNACNYICCFILPFPNHHTGKHLRCGCCSM